MFSQSAFPEEFQFRDTDGPSPVYTSPTLSPTLSSNSSPDLQSDTAKSSSVISDLRFSRVTGGSKSEKDTRASTHTSTYTQRSTDDNSIDVAALLLASRKARSLHRLSADEGTRTYNVSESERMTQLPPDVPSPSQGQGIQVRSRSQLERAEETDIVNMGTATSFKQKTNTNTSSSTGASGVDKSVDRNIQENTDINLESWTQVLQSPVGSEASQRKSRARTNTVQTGQGLAFNRSSSQLDYSVQTNPQSVSHSLADLSDEIQELADLSIRYKLSKRKIFYFYTEVEGSAYLSCTRIW